MAGRGSYRLFVTEVPTGQVAFIGTIREMGETPDAPNGRTVTSGPTQPWTWEIAEMFKIQGGKIHQIEAILQQVPCGMNSGWSNWRQGMSTQPQDVTGVPERPMQHSL